ncbi:MAG: methionyl-tRNA formyltransferase [Parcubacteria group bacterium]|jgi:methionyl-tRNA formyltransferase
MKTNKSAIKLRTIFMGTSSFAENILSALLTSQYNIISVYTQPDKKVGRTQELQKSAVKLTAEKNNIPVYGPARIDESVFQELKNQKPDLIVVAAYGRILPENVLALPGFGALNVHASLLPKYRGPSPIQNAILNGETETGITIMLMNKGIDTGDILSQRSVTIDKDETAVELSQKLSKVSADLLLETVPLWIERKIKSQKQAESMVSLCQLIERTDGKIVWTDDAETIYNRYRALHPWPGIYTFWEHGDTLKRIKLNKINYLKNNSETKHHIGEVFQIGEKFGIQTNSGTIVLEELQLEGKTTVPVVEFINGYPNFVGSILK